MKYYSLEHKSPSVSFKEAVIRGIAPDRGLYFPERIEPLPSEIFKNIDQFSNTELAYRAISQFTKEDIPEEKLREIVEEVLQFNFPLVPVGPDISALELFHGPTMAFKDVGARFMAQCLGYFSSSEDGEITVLVATSGDTGGAVARGFLGVEGVKVVILYPSGKVSDIQEKQLTTLGQNITALEVNGSFDDCQHMVKTAFLDKDITTNKQLTSANSINVARWLPQQFYYFIACRQLIKEHPEIIFSVPSGNFGNLCAGMVAEKQGLPVKHFVASTNINDTVPEYMRSGSYVAKASKPTISNAMDVGDPSNFIRIQEIYGNEFDTLHKHMSSYSFSDTETRDAMRNIYQNSGYIADPHGAVGYLGLKKYMNANPGAFGVFLETAHPVKFLEEVESTLNLKLNIPEQIAAVLDKEKRALAVASYNDLKEYLLSG